LGGGNSACGLNLTNPLCHAAFRRSGDLKLCKKRSWAGELLVKSGS
jgi:hypothetical protein